MSHSLEPKLVTILKRGYSKRMFLSDLVPGIGRAAIPEGVQVCEVDGSLFFGAVNQFSESMRVVDEALLRARTILGT